MITHFLGADTSVSYDWCDDEGDPVMVTSARFIATREESTGIDWLDTEPGLSINGDYAISILLDDQLDLDPGNWSYRVTAVSSGDTTLLSAGLLRVQE